MKQPAFTPTRNEARNCYIRCFTLCLIVLCLIPRHVHAADVLPLNSNIETPQVDAEQSPLGFRVIGHFPEIYAISLAVSETRNLAFLSFVASLPEKSGVRIIDISSPQRMRKIGTFYSDAIVDGIRVNNTGTLIFVSYHGGPFGGIQIVNIKKPESPTVLGEYGLGSGGKIVGLSRKEDRLYLLDEKGNFVILDISDAGNIRQLGSAAVGYPVKGIWVSPTDKFAYFSKSGTLKKIDFENPKKMHITSLISVDSSQYTDITTVVSNEKGNPIIFGLSNMYDQSKGGFGAAPTIPNSNAPVEKISVAHLQVTQTYDMQLRGTNVYAMTPEQGLVETSVADPYAPEIVGTMSIPLSNLIVNFGTSGFYVSKDENLLFVPITVRKGEDTEKVGGVTIYSRQQNEPNNGVAVNQPMASPSFDCTRATLDVEKLICNDIVLSKLDRDLIDAYHQALQDSTDKQKDLKDQRAWLKNVRNACTDANCLKTIYLDRIAALRVRSKQAQ